MTITIAQPHLVRVLSTAAATIATKSTVPALSGLLIQARDGVFSAVGSDLFTTTRATCPCVDTLHPIVAQGDILDRVKALPPGDVRITVDGPALVVSSGKRRFKLAWMSADEFPKVHAEEATGDEINAKDLATAISRASVAMSHDASRGICGLRFKGGEVHASDGHRCAIVPSPIDIDCRISAESAAAAIRFCDGAESVRLEIRGTRLFITRDDATMSSTLLDADAFPDLRQYFETSPKDCVVKIDRQALTASFRSLQHSTHKESRRVAMRFERDAVHLKAEGGERGEGEDVIECEASKPFEFACSADYLIAALNGTDAAEVKLTQNGDKWAPLLLLGATTTQLVMGLR